VLSTKARSVQSVLAIDPGAGGAICCLFKTATDIYPMPDTERDLWDLIRSYREAVRIALIEKVHAMPKQGVSSTFAFGQNYGFLRACLIAAEIPFREITPRKWMDKYVPVIVKKKPSVPVKDMNAAQTKVWKSYLAKLKKEHKNNLKAAAQQLFPKLKVTLKTADALLLAHYARNYLT